MANAIRIDSIWSAWLPWLPTRLVAGPYGVREDEIESAVRGFERDLWAANAGLVPDRSRKAQAWSAFAWSLKWLTIVLGLAWAPAALLAPSWVNVLMPPPIEGQAFLIGLVRYAAPVVLVVLAAFAVWAARVSQRLRLPFDVARMAASGRHRLSGAIVRALGTLLSRRSLGWLAMASIVAIFAAGIALKLVPLGAGRQAVEAAVIAIPLIAFFCGLLGWLFLWIVPSPLRSPLDRAVTSIDRLGRQLQQASASDARSVDRRKPILLLRSFRDDNLKVSERTGQIRLEEVLADALPRLGPLIAIGRPGQALADLGASRDYYSDAQWREAVSAWMNEALVIVVVAGRSAGLAWELETIAARRHVDKMIVFMPPADRAGRWDNLRRALTSIPASVELTEKMPSGLLCIHGTPEGGLTTVSANGTAAGDYRRAVHYAIFAMFCRQRPVGRTD